MQDSPVSRELLSILVCPVTRLKVQLASDQLISELNTRIDSGNLLTVDKQKVTEKLAAGLVREDSKILYPIIDGIPVMLAEAGIAI